MTRQYVIEDLQNRIWKGRILNIDDLKLEISCAEYDGEAIDEYDDVLFPMGWNTCDRCGALCDSELDLIWLDYLELDENEPKDKAVLDGLLADKNARALNGETPFDYCAVCDKCFNELKTLGGWKGNGKD